MAEDVEAYGEWMRDEAQRRIGHLYPDAISPDGESLTPIAWIWARTVESPDPAWPGHVPLVASWTLRKRPGKPTVWIQPIIDRSAMAISYEIRHGDKPDRERTVGRGGGVCIATGAAIPLSYIRSQGKANKLGTALIAVVAQGPHGRVYCDATEQETPHLPEPDDNFSLGAMPIKHRDFKPPIYGMGDLADLFTPRQLVALTTFSGLLGEVADKVRSDIERAGPPTDRGEDAGSHHDTTHAAHPRDALADTRTDHTSPSDTHRWSSPPIDNAHADTPKHQEAGVDRRIDLSDAAPLGQPGSAHADEVRLRDGGRGAQAYADAVVTYLAFAVDKCADYWSTISTWINTGETMRNTFGRQAIPITWDFAECNPFSDSTGNWMSMVGWIARAIEHVPASVPGTAVQRDAQAVLQDSADVMLSTDPPYYDNISYADLSDFFYVWLRRNLSEVWPSECSTMFTPKAQELIANQHRAGSKERAKQHFESGMAEFMEAVAASVTPEVPATIYYAYKATENQDGEVRSTGWDTFLQAVIDAGLQVNATWPLRTELGNRLLASGTNALASSVVLACRPRPASALRTMRGEFIRALRRELPEALRVLQSGNIAPVDMAQSAIGPGIKVFSRYAAVLEADGTPMPVSEALGVINKVLGEVLDGEEADFDPDTRFALTWFAQHGFEPGPSGDADSIARAKNTSLAGIVESGVGEARSGKFRLYTRDELNPEWHPASDTRFTVWEATQHLTARLDHGEVHAAALLRDLRGRQEAARRLAYQLHQKADDRGWASEAFAYNALVHVWPNMRLHAATLTTQDSLL